MLAFTAVFAMVIAYVALVTAYLALRTLAKLRRLSAVLGKGTETEQGRQSLLEATERHGLMTAEVAAEMADLRAQVATAHAELRAEMAASSARADAADAARRSELGGYLATATDSLNEYRTALDAEVARSLRNIALVRYDAFDDMAGRMSFSLAMLDDNGDGITVSAIAGRSDTRVYAKGVHSGHGEHELSPEEIEAVAAAGRNRSAHWSTRRRTDRKAS
jgi:hypothetical protein